MTSTLPSNRPLSHTTLWLFAVMIGIVAGFGAVVFRGLIGLFHNLLFLGKVSVIYYANVHTPPSPWGAWVILIPVVGGLGVAFLVKKVVFTDGSPAELQELLRAHPYERFPVVLNGTVKGVLTRREAEAALAAKRKPNWEAAVTCLPSHTIADLQNRLIDSGSLIVVLVDRPGGQVLGVVTLHDVLRAQTSMSRSGTG